MCLKKGSGQLVMIIYTINLSLCTQTAGPNPFRGTHCLSFCTFLEPFPSGDLFWLPIQEMSSLKLLLYLKKCALNIKLY